MEQPTDQAEAAARGRYDGIFGAAPAASAVPTHHHPPPVGAAARVGWGLLRWARTAAITLGVLYVIGWAASVALVAGATSRLWRPTSYANTGERAAAVMPALAYRLPTDPAITPAQAGAALGALGPVPQIPRGSGFAYRQMEHVSGPWRSIPLPRDIFPPEVGVGSYGLPSRTKILPWVGAHRVTALQRQALRLIGTAQVWKEFDRVARAGSVDILGGRLIVPFRDNANYFAMPILPYAATRELAAASLSRAAWHLAEGRRDSAEFALKSAISFGAALMENASFVIERLVGATVVANGRDGLIQLYALSGDPRGPALQAATAKVAAEYRRPDVLAPIGPGNVPEAQRRLMAIVEDPSLPFSIRLETIAQLRAAACGTFRNVAFGGDNAVERAAAALRAAARFDSQRSLVDLAAQPFGSAGVYDMLDQADWPQARTIAFVSRMYFNPRLAQCAISTTGAFQ